MREITRNPARATSRARNAASRIRRISSSAMLREAADRMKRCQVDSLPVVENHAVVGRITECDITQAVAAGMSPETTPVKYAMTGGVAHPSPDPEKEEVAVVEDPP